MDVTKENFDSVFSRLQEDFKNAQFIAIDTEFTGLRVEGASSPNFFDTLDDLYLKDRLKAETFMAIQVGLVIFIYEETTNSYSHLGYNFYVYPSSYSGANFTCQSTSIQFLTQHGFDFNKLFKSGIPYLRSEEAEKLIEKATERHKKNQSSENLSKIDIPSEHQETVRSIIKKIKDYVQANKKISFNTEKFNGYVRRLIYCSVQQQFGSRVFLESNKDDTMTVSTGLTADEVKDKQREMLNAQRNKILNEIGFCKVIKLLIESKKLLVGHNLLLDILFLIRQFVVPLPATYSEFKELVKFIFPSLIDTKYMASIRIKNIKDTSLNTLVEFFINSNKLKDVQVNENGLGYKINEKKLHEAAYDAYLTGLSLLAMAEDLRGASIYKDLPNSSFLTSFLNNLSIPKLCDFNSMNLGGADPEPNRNNVYHLTFPKEWNQNNITGLFKDCGYIKIHWINDISAFVKVDPEYTKEVEKILKTPNESYKLLTHSQFKSSQILNPARELNAQNLVNTESQNQINLSDSIKKRKIEDIGEVIERPQKKLCSK